MLRTARFEGGSSWPLLRLRAVPRTHLGRAYARIGRGETAQDGPTCQRAVFCTISTQASAAIGGLTARLQAVDGRLDAHGAVLVRHDTTLKQQDDRLMTLEANLTRLREDINPGCLVPPNRPAVGQTCFPPSPQAASDEQTGEFADP